MIVDGSRANGIFCILTLNAFITNVIHFWFNIWKIFAIKNTKYKSYLFVNIGK